MSRASHVYLVKTLYRRILNLHRSLPITLKALGDQYVKDEFRRHKNVTLEQAEQFVQEWKMYADMLQQQQQQSSREDLGANLSHNQIDAFSNEQLGQLYALQQEATKPDEKTDQ